MYLFINMAGVCKPAIRKYKYNVTVDMFAVYNLIGKYCFAAYTKVQQKCHAISEMLCNFHDEDIYG